MIEVKKDVYLFDTTLRDGEQAEQITFSLDDKIRIALKLDEFGIPIIHHEIGGNRGRRIFFNTESFEINVRFSGDISRKRRKISKHN